MDIANVTTSAFDFLKEKIIMGELKPGQKLNETSLALQLGISRPPLREAFRLLEKYHFVKSIPRKGTYVMELSIEDFKEISQIRQMIECYVIDYLKEHHIKSLPCVIESVNEASRSTVSVDLDTPNQILNHTNKMMDFHVRLVELADNSRLNNLFHLISMNLLRYQFVYFYYKSSTQHSLDNHMKIVKAIESGLYDHAKEELKKHMDYVMSVVKQNISKTAAVEQVASVSSQN